jgi:hypothetical protein
MNPFELPLPRPEYVAAPEVLVSSLAWRVSYIPGWDESDSHPRTGLPIGLTFRTGGRNADSFTFIGTDPIERTQLQEDGNGLPEWSEALGTAGLSSTGTQEDLGHAIASGLRGVRATRAKGQAATPVSPSTALLQNVRGLASKKNPARPDAAIESMFELGRNQRTSAIFPASASSAWLNASRRRAGSDDLIGRIDSALSTGVFPELPQDRSNPEALTVPLDLGLATPFGWFFDAWTQLTSDDWVDALPARRWVDWASAVLRLAYASGYLWESRWLEVAARQSLLSEDEEVSNIPGLVELVNASGPLIPWIDSTEKTSVRDVLGILPIQLSRGAALRGVFKAAAAAANAGYPAEIFGAVRNNEELRNSVEHELGAPKGDNENAWEAVKYALTSRGLFGPYADHYGLLKQRGRYLVVDPSTEWIAAIASLSCSGPGTETSVGEVAVQLRRIGLRPGTAELTARLEQAGLARSSADADAAVRVQSAY